MMKMNYNKKKPLLSERFGSMVQQRNTKSEANPDTASTCNKGMAQNILADEIGRYVHSLREESRSVPLKNLTVQVAVEPNVSHTEKSKSTSKMCENFKNKANKGSDANQNERQMNKNRQPSKETAVIDNTESVVNVGSNRMESKSPHHRGKTTPSPTQVKDITNIYQNHGESISGSSGKKNNTICPNSHINNFSENQTNTPHSNHVHVNSRFNPDGRLHGEGQGHFYNRKDPGQVHNRYGHWKTSNETQITQIPQDADQNSRQSASRFGDIVQKRRNDPRNIGNPHSPRYEKNGDSTSPRYGKTGNQLSPRYGKPGNLQSPRYGKPGNLQSPRYGKSANPQSPRYGKQSYQNNSSRTSPKYNSGPYANQTSPRYDPAGNQTSPSYNTTTYDRNHAKFSHSKYGRFENSGNHVSVEGQSKFDYLQGSVDGNQHQKSPRYGYNDFINGGVHHNNDVPTSMNLIDGHYLQTGSRDFETSKKQFSQETRVEDQTNYNNCHYQFDQNNDRVSVGNYGFPMHNAMHSASNRFAFPGDNMDRQNYESAIQNEHNFKVDNMFPNDQPDWQNSNKYSVLPFELKDGTLPADSVGKYDHHNSLYGYNLHSSGISYRDMPSPEAQLPDRRRRKSESDVSGNNTDNGNIQREQENLVNTLLQQCSAMVENEKDKQTLKKAFSIIEHETKSFVSTNNNQSNLEIGTQKQKATHQNIPTPTKVFKMTESNFSPTSVSPESSSEKFSSLKFEGRTLLKGGVAPRHIPKNYVAKIHKVEPEDPRYSFPNYFTKIFKDIPLPPWCVEIFGEDKVRRLNTGHVSHITSNGVKNHNEPKKVNTNNSMSLLSAVIENKKGNEKKALNKNRDIKEPNKQRKDSKMVMEGNAEPFTKAVSGDHKICKEKSEQMQQANPVFANGPAPSLSGQQLTPQDFTNCSQDTALSFNTNLSPYKKRKLQIDI